MDTLNTHVEPEASSTKLMVRMLEIAKKIAQWTALWR